MGEDGKSRFRLFVPALIDDMGLSLAAFRVLGTLSRRGVGAYPSRESIAKTCRIHGDTVGSALRELEERGLVKRVYRRGRSNIFELTEPPRNEGCPLKTGEVESEGALHPEDKGGEYPETKGGHPPETKGDKGYPLKVLQEGTPLKGKPGDTAEVMFPWAEINELPEVFWRYMRYTLQVTAEYLADAFQAIRRRKLKYRDKYTRRNWVAVLQQELEDYAKNRATRPSEGIGGGDGHAYGFLGEGDPHGDLARLKTLGVRVKPHVEKLGFSQESVWEAQPHLRPPSEQSFLN